MKYQEWSAEVPSEITDFKARHVLGPEITSHRLKLSAQIIRNLLRMIPKYCGNSIREKTAEYNPSPFQELLENVPVSDYQFTHNAPRTTNEESPNE